MAQLPVDAKVGKLLVIGASLGCLSPALTIAACLSYKSPFSAPFEQQDAAMRAKQGFASTGVQPLHTATLMFQAHAEPSAVFSCRGIL